MQEIKGSGATSNRSFRAPLSLTVCVDLASFFESCDRFGFVPATDRGTFGGPHHHSPLWHVRRGQRGQKVTKFLSPQQLHSQEGLLWPGLRWQSHSSSATHNHWGEAIFKIARAALRNPEDNYTTTTTSAAISCASSSSSGSSNDTLDGITLRPRFPFYRSFALEDRVMAPFRALSGAKRRTGTLAS